MKYLHIVPGADDVANGMARVARLLAKEQGDAEVVDLSAVSGQSLAVSEGRESLGFVESLEEVWVHGMWLPKEWAICRRVIKAGKRLVRMTHGSLSPVYLKNQSPIKKRLVGPIERYWLRKADRIVATCDAEKEWIEAYLGKKCPEIAVEDIKRFFDFSRKERIGRVEERGNFISRVERVDRVEGDGLEFRVSGSELGEELAVSGQGIRPLRVLATHRDASKPSDREAELAVSGDGCNSELDTRNRELHVLYLGRRHPLKGVEYLGKAVDEINDDSRSRESKLNSGIGNLSYEEDLSIHCSTSTSNFDAKRIDLRIVSGAKGEELEKVWEWCDVLVLPTLSENFGLVVAEALERGKRVITTDGAPVWESSSRSYESKLNSGVGNSVDERDLPVRCSTSTSDFDSNILSGHGGRLLYLKGYRDGSDAKRVELLRDALEMMV